MEYYNTPMSKGPVLIVVLIALLLGAASFFVLKNPAASQGPEPVAWLAGLDMTQLRSVQVDWGKGQGMASLLREPTTGEWLLVKPGTPSRPIGVERVRPFLRLLNDTARAPNEPGVKVPSEGTLLSFAMADATTREIRVGSSPLGGKVVASIQDGRSPRIVMIDDGIRKMVQPDSLLAWRDTRLVPRSGIEPSRIRIETPRGKLEFARVQGHWGITQPFPCPASEDAIKALIRQIATMKGERLLDDVPADGPIVGADSPSSYLRLESDLRIAREGGTDRRTLVEEIRVGKPSDLGSASFYVFSGATLVDPGTGKQTPLWGPSTLTITKESLDTIGVDVSAYASRRAVPMPGADVNAITLSPDSSPFSEDRAAATTSSTELTKFKLSLKGWESVSADGSIRAIEGADAAGIAGLVRALADVDSAAVGTSPSADVSSLASCVVAGVDEVSTTVRLGYATDAGHPVLIVRTGKVARVYNEEWAVGLIAWIRAHIKPEG
jgi:hypothetical protein